MDFRQLEAFVAVVDLASFSKAGEKLFLTQPTVSSHINSLKKELGQRLIARNNKLVYVNEAGQMLYKYAVRLLSLRDEAVSHIMGADTGEGSVSIMATTIPAKYMIPNLICGFRQRYPNIAFSISRCTPEEVTARILEDQVHLGMSGTPIEPALCHNDPIAVDNLVVITPNTDYYRRLGANGFPVDALYTEPFIYMTGNAGNHYDLGRYLPFSEGRKLNVVSELGDTEMTIRAVEEGVGISVVSEFAAEDFARFGRILPFYIEGGQAIRKLYLVRRKKAHLSRVEQLFIDYVLATSKIHA